MPSLLIRDVEVIGRYPGTLRLTPGLNVIVGEKDKGKTTAFKCMNGVLGGKIDKDTFQNEMGENEWIRALVEINGEQYTVYRAVKKLYEYVFMEHGNVRADNPGALPKLLVSSTQGANISYLEFLMEALGLQQFQFMRSLEMPAQDKDQFSFRSILRHIYVRGDGHEDLVHKEWPHMRKMGFLMSTGILDVERVVGSARYKDTYNRFVRLKADRERIWSTLRNIAGQHGYAADSGVKVDFPAMLLKHLRTELSDVEGKVAALFRNPPVDPELAEAVTPEPERLLTLKARLDSLIVHHHRTEAEVKRLQVLQDQVAARIEKKARFAASASSMLKLPMVHDCPYCGHALEESPREAQRATKVDVLKSVSHDKEELAIAKQLLKAKSQLALDIAADVEQTATEYRAVSRTFDQSLYSTAYADATSSLMERRSRLRHDVLEVSRLALEAERTERAMDECRQLLTQYDAWDPDTQTAAALRWNDIIQPRTGTKDPVFLDMDEYLNTFYQAVLRNFKHARMSDQFEPVFKLSGSDIERRSAGSTTKALIILGYFYALFQHSLIDGNVPYPRLLLIDGLYGSWPLNLEEALTVCKQIAVASAQTEQVHQVVLSLRQDPHDAYSRVQQIATDSAMNVIDLRDKGFLSL